MSIAKSSMSTNPLFSIDYGAELEKAIADLVNVIAAHPEIIRRYPPRWIAIKLLEEDHDIQVKLLALKGGSAVINKSQQSILALRSNIGDELDIYIADRRYQWINQLMHSAVQRSVQSSISISDRIDHILTHRYLGIPIFLAVMWVVFKLTAEVSAPYLNWIDFVINGPITNWAIGLLGLFGLSCGMAWLNYLYSTRWNYRATPWRGNNPPTR